MGSMRLYRKASLSLQSVVYGLFPNVRRHLTKRHVEEAAPVLVVMPLENAIYNVGSNCSSSTENSYTNLSKPSPLEMFMKNSPALPIFFPNFFPLALSLLSFPGVELLPL